MIPSRATWHTFIGGILLVALSGGADGQLCGQAAEAGSDLAQRIEARIMVVEVEVDIFSGMPNPRWTLSEADAATFVAKLSELQAGEAKPRLDRLGYRGVDVVVRASQRAERKIFIHNGTVETSDGPTIRFLLDSQRALERWLIETGRSRLSPEAMRAIQADLQRQP